MDFTRREFLSLGGKLAALMGLGIGGASRMADALESLAKGDPPVLWLQAQACSGCSVSFLNASGPLPAEVLISYISLLFHPTLSTATGALAMEVVENSIKKGGYFLVVEGSVPAKMPKACYMGEAHKPLGTWIAEAAKNALGVIAYGTCAAYGGIPAAQNNPTGAVSVPEFFKQQGIVKPTILIPGCPSHPDWLVGTVASIVSSMAKGKGVVESLPELDSEGRPKMFFSRLIHDQCPRFSDYERENFAKNFSEDGCLFRLGCCGPNTKADCTLRMWNNGINTCIRAGSPCIGCAGKTFALDPNYPFYTLERAQATERVTK